MAGLQDGMQVAQPEILSFLMIGQSNMAGRGDFGDVEPIDNPLCYMLRMGRWQKMSEPINPDRAILDSNWHSGIGLAASFADALSKHEKRPIGLIPCADGGTCMNQWMPGEVLYDHALMMTRLALRSSTLGGILWHQGESDCNREEDVLAYKEKFITMISALRKELGAEHLPLIMGELSECAGLSWGMEDRPEKLNRIFHEIAREVPNCAVASSNGLTLKADGIHFDAASCRIFGKRYFDQYLRIR